MKIPTKNGLLYGGILLSICLLTACNSEPFRANFTVDGVDITSAEDIAGHPTEADMILVSKGELVAFRDASTGNGTDDIKIRRWNFGDGGVDKKREASTSYTFMTADTIFEVELCVDDLGCVSKYVKVVGEEEFGDIVSISEPEIAPSTDTDIDIAPVPTPNPEPEAAEIDRAAEEKRLEAERLAQAERAQAAEEARIARLEEARIAQAKKKEMDKEAEEKRLAAERIAQQNAKQEKISKENEAAERRAKEEAQKAKENAEAFAKAEAERIAQEEKKAAEKKRLEAERLAKEAEAERKRLEAEELANKAPASIGNATRFTGVAALSATDLNNCTDFSIKNTSLQLNPSKIVALMSAVVYASDCGSITLKLTGQGVDISEIFELSPGKNQLVFDELFGVELINDKSYSLSLQTNKSSNCPSEAPMLLNVSSCGKSSTGDQQLALNYGGKVGLFKLKYQH